ncbi:hypothetical protein [Pelosinus baikalensis]|uniref:DUF4145 domain-containing protein n=1 Tax=Pelosinus baikalensis TaxID=2892015 RepID=A0ABS8I0C5_9FIRM|nr:hypothetical protein [Pelosinus baikalensis]MCC5468356.1 hypothetical protein [Pelosinus baikalensis]
MMIDDQRFQLKIFLDKYFFELQHEGGGICELPVFDLYARDYLRFAEESLNKNSNYGLISCISNLKRAMDCQIDTFFYTINLYNSFQKRNLKFEKKLGLIEAIGLFGTRSLTKLNQIRNKMEHKYEVPKIQEIELYFELVEALVRSMELATMALNWNSQLDFSIYSGDTRIGYFNSEYNCGENEPFVTTQWSIENIEKKCFNVKIDDYIVFAYFFRIHLLLYQSQAIGSREYLLSRIEI